MEILYLQKPEVLPAQRPLVEEALAGLEGAEVRFAGSVEEAHRFPEADILITRVLPWLPEVLASLPAVRWIHFLSAGVDGIWEMDVDWSRYRISKSTGVHAATISEYVLGAVLYALKGFGTFARQQRERAWQRFWLDECAGKTLGIVGVGTIGARLARHAKALGMRVVGTVTTPRPIPDVDEVFGMEGLGRVLEASDFVVLLVPLTERTRGLLDAEALGRMKETAWLINVARGEVVVEAALVAALQEGRIAGAVLDVFEEEPLPAESPLWAMENVLVTPHVAGTTQHYVPRALGVFRENAERLARTGELATPVSLEKGY